MPSGFAGGGLRGARVWFAHARTPDLEPIHAFFGTREVAFGCPDSGIAFRSVPPRPPDAGRRRPHAGDRPSRSPTPLCARRMGGATAASLSARVAERLAATLPAGTDVVDVASALHMSARTLQRRLEEEGTRFTEVLDRVRLELARTALRDPETTLTDVAFRLGFGDLATFSRAFKRWTGKPPGQWRRC